MNEGSFAQAFLSKKSLFEFVGTIVLLATLFSSVGFSGYWSGSNISACSQESANVSNDCGGLGTGGYLVAGDWTGSYGNMNDGDWSTYVESNYNGAMLINYTIPQYTVNATWYVKDGDGTLSYQIPSQCLRSDGLLSLWVNAGGGSSWYGYCLPEGADYNDGLLAYDYWTLNPYSYTFYEENITWGFAPLAYYCVGIECDKTAHSVLGLAPVVIGLGVLAGMAGMFLMRDEEESMIALVMKGGMIALIAVVMLTILVSMIG